MTGTGNTGTIIVKCLYSQGEKGDMGLPGLPGADAMKVGAVDRLMC